MTSEQAMYVMEHFAKDALEDKYEAIYSVHTDKEHVHGHLIWNSVSLATGEKYVSPKGHWKRTLQTITNKYCKELGLGIMPAEYSKDPKNLTRDQWELEQSFQDYILKDAKFCVAAAGSLGHFQFLMKRLGYEFKANKYIEVRIPGQKKYHKLAQLDKGFQESELKYQFNNPYVNRPYYYVDNMRRYSKGSCNTFQRGYYSKIYRLRMVEQKRFKLGSAYYAEEIKKMYTLQERYLLMKKNRIETPIQLIHFEISIEKKQKEISNRQKEIYRYRSIRKRGIQDTSELFIYQQWHNRQQKELDQLKQGKKECKEQLKLIEAIWADSNKPEFHEVLEYETIDEYAKMEMPEYEVEKVVPKPVGDEVVLLDEMGSVVEKLVNDVELVEAVGSVEEVSSAVEVVEEMVQEEAREIQKLSYYVYRMYDEIEKAKVIGIDDGMDLNAVMDKVKSFYLANGYEVKFDIMFDESQSIFEVIKRESEERRAVLISIDIAEKGGYGNMSYAEKAEVFQFDMMDNKGNLGIFMKVMKELGKELGFDELYEEYQKVYEVGMDQSQGDIEFGRIRK